MTFTPFEFIPYVIVYTPGEIVIFEGRYQLNLQTKYEHSLLSWLAYPTEKESWSSWKHRSVSNFEKILIRDETTREVFRSLADYLISGYVIKIENHRIWTYFHGTTSGSVSAFMVKTQRMYGSRSSAQILGVLKRLIETGMEYKERIWRNSHNTDSLRFDLYFDIWLTLSSIKIFL